MDDMPVSGYYICSWQHPLRYKSQGLNMVVNEKSIYGQIHSRFYNSNSSAHGNALGDSVISSTSFFLIFRLLSQHSTNNMREKHFFVSQYPHTTCWMISSSLAHSFQMPTFSYAKFPFIYEYISRLSVLIHLSMPHSSNCYSSIICFDT